MCTYVHYEMPHAMNIAKIGTNAYKRHDSNVQHLLGSMPHGLGGFFRDWFDEKISTCLLSSKLNKNNMLDM